MLILSRLKGEKIVIRCGEAEVIVTLTESHSHRARIGIEAPREVQIDREEVYEAKRKAVA